MVITLLNVQRYSFKNLISRLGSDFGDFDYENIFMGDDDDDDISIAMCL